MKYLLLGLTVAIVAVPAQAQVVELACYLTPSEQQRFVTQGDPESARQVVHLLIDQAVRRVTEWETSPRFPSDDRTTYDAEFSGTIASWTHGDINDGPQAHDSVDASTNILTTTDPEGDATQWNCL